jgi:hypothetical protein
MTTNYLQSQLSKSNIIGFERVNNCYKIYRNYLWSQYINNYGNSRLNAGIGTDNEVAIVISSPVQCINRLEMSTD